jgi:site-specific DNA recombinase
MQTRQRQGDDEECNFVFSGLLQGGHCGCALVAEIKKQRYVYYHCTGFKGKCSEPYVRQEALEAEFSGWLRRLALDQEVVDWISTALRESQADKRRYHEEASRLKADHQRLLNRLETLYEDKLDGRIDVAFFDRKSRDWRNEQNRLLDAIKEHEKANESYMEEGIRILDLGRRAGDLFDKQPAHEKRRLLNCVMSAASWKDGSLTIEFRQPFDMLLDATPAVEERQSAEENFRTENRRLSNFVNASKHGANGGPNGRFENWLPGMDSNHELDKILKSHNLLILKSR